MSSFESTPSLETLSKECPEREDDARTTGSSPAPKSGAPNRHGSAASPKTWSKEDAIKLLKLFFRSLFFVMAKAGFETSQVAAEACKKVVIQNLIERILVGVNLEHLKAGGLWGKVLTAAVKSRVEAEKAAGKQMLTCVTDF